MVGRCGINGLASPVSCGCLAINGSSCSLVRRSIKQTSTPRVTLRRLRQTISMLPLEIHTGRATLGDLKETDMSVLKFECPGCGQHMECDRACAGDIIHC